MPYPIMQPPIACSEVLARLNSCYSNMLISSCEYEYDALLECIARYREKAFEKKTYLVRHFGKKTTESRE
jgi:hypothetical protein